MVRSLGLALLFSHARVGLFPLAMDVATPAAVPPATTTTTTTHYVMRMRMRLTLTSLRNATAARRTQSVHTPTTPLASTSSTSHTIARAAVADPATQDDPDVNVRLADAVESSLPPSPVSDKQPPPPTTTRVGLSWQSARSRLQHAATCFRDVCAATRSHVVARTAWRRSHASDAAAPSAVRPLDLTAVEPEPEAEPEPEMRPATASTLAGRTSAISISMSSLSDSSSDEDDSNVFETRQSMLHGSDRHSVALAGTDADGDDPAVDTEAVEVCLRNRFARRCSSTDSYESERGGGDGDDIRDIYRISVLSDFMHSGGDCVSTAGTSSGSEADNDNENADNVDEPDEDALGSLRPDSDYFQRPDGVVVRIRSAWV